MRQDAAILVLAGLLMTVMAGCQPQAPAPGLDRKGLTEQVILKVPGCTCTSTAAEIQYTLEALEGVSRAESDWEDHLVTVTYNPGQASLEDMTQALKSRGYPIVEVVEGP